ncbi:MAG: molybdate ABC transporter substrate-binding protein [Hydrogenothermaceae bacterium]|nr:molybdate ABC transporter substrate-binding protein [Hydrogenothermaceae bacterium]
MFKIVLSLLFSLLLSLKVYAGDIIVYAAADLVYAFKEIQQLYKKVYPQDDVKIIFGSSGKGYHQILEGAPYDMIFSADMGYVEKLQEKGLTISKPKPYAIGRIVLWVRKDSNIPLNDGINAILNQRVKKIGIANWEHAPYGVAAKQCLDNFKLFDKVKDKLVLGENISQTAQYVQTGAADIGFLALSIANSDPLTKEGIYYLIPESCHSQILQGYVITKNAVKSEDRLSTARRFEEFISTPAIRKVFIKYGFMLPGEKVE